MSNGDIGPPMTADDWEDWFWKKDFLPFNYDAPSEDLTKVYENALGYRRACRMFVPLCGKCVDMIWLEENGHDVVGLERSEIAVKRFFKDNDLRTNVVTRGPFKIYKAIEKRITIFCGDLFDANKDLLGTFEAIWDKSSFTSMYPLGNDRKRYLQLMRSLAHDENIVYLLKLIAHHSTNHKGPPYSIDYDTFARISGDIYDSKILAISERPCFYVSEDPIKINLCQLSVKNATAWHRVSTKS